MKTTSPVIKPQWWGGILIGLAGLFLGMTSCQTSSLNSHQLYEDPVQQSIAVYDEVWQAINAEYVDQSANHQEWKRWRHKYDRYIKSQDDAYLAINTMLSSLNDPYTRLLNPHDVAEQTMRMDARLFGIGVQIAQHGHQVVIISPMEGSPAEKAGLKPLDHITAVEGKSLIDLNIDQIADLIRGPKDTPVILTIQRGNKTFNVHIVRDEITIKSVHKESISPEIGYIRLSSFISQEASDEMVKALRSFKDKQGLILDLRGNNGGLLRNALKISDMFLTKGDIVSVVGRDGEREVYRSDKGTLFNKPVVVLINQGSASASEIVSGALKDNNRAILVGQTSYGKGMVQKINPLTDGSDLYITISKYFTPNGEDINKKGIAPNVEVALTVDDVMHDRDTQKDKAIAELKKRLGQLKPATVSQAP